MKKNLDRKFIGICAAAVLLVALLVGGLFLMKHIIIHRHIEHEQIKYYSQYEYVS